MSLLSNRSREYIYQGLRGGAEELLWISKTNGRVAFVAGGSQGMGAEVGSMLAAEGCMLLHGFEIDNLVKGTRLVVAYLREMIEERRRKPLDDLISFSRLTYRSAKIYGGSACL